MSIWSQLTNLDNQEDIKSEMTKKYRNTILKIVYEKKVIYGKYVGSNKMGYHVFNDLHDQQIQIANNTEIDVRIWYPKRGLYNITIHDRACFVYYARTANRQYRRGMNEENTRITDPCFETFNYGNNLFSLNVITQIAENKQHVRHLDEAIHLVSDSTNNYLSYAMNNRWGISAPMTNNAKQIQLWLYDKPVGHIENNIITLNNKTFIQELIDESNKDWYAGYEIR